MRCLSLSVCLFCWPTILDSGNMYIYSTISSLKKKMLVVSLKVSLHFYLPIMATSLQQAFSSVPKAAAMERLIRLSSQVLRVFNHFLPAPL